MLNLKQKCVFGGIQTSQTGGQPYSNTFPYEVSLYSLVKPIHRNSYEICLWKGNVRMHFNSISTKSKFKFHRFLLKNVVCTFYLLLFSSAVYFEPVSPPVPIGWANKSIIFNEILWMPSYRQGQHQQTNPLPTATPQPCSSVTSKKSRKCL